MRYRTHWGNEFSFEPEDVYREKEQARKAAEPRPAVLEDADAAVPRLRQPDEAPDTHPTLRQPNRAGGER